MNNDNGNGLVAKSGSIGSNTAIKQGNNVQANVSNGATNFSQNNYGNGGPSS